MTDEERGHCVERSGRAFEEYSAALAEYKRLGKESLGVTGVRNLLFLDPERPMDYSSARDAVAEVWRWPNACSSSARGGSR